MIQSSPAITMSFPSSHQTLSPPSSITPSISKSTHKESIRQSTPTQQDEIVDIANSKKLLRPTSTDTGLQSLTPRKRALARKTSNMSNTSNHNNVNGGLSSSPTINTIRSSDLLKSPDFIKIDDQIDVNEEEIDPEAKISLYQHPKVKILSFEELNENISDDSSQQGRLIGFGKFEIFQLHQKLVSYLQCGSVVYPILPRLKILKISSNQFIVPLSNPERYWRIVIENDGNHQSIAHEDSIKELEKVFKKICHLRNLFVPSEKPAESSGIESKVQGEVNVKEESLSSSPLSPLNETSSEAQSQPLLPSLPLNEKKVDELQIESNKPQEFALQKIDSRDIQSQHINTLVRNTKENKLQYFLHNSNSTNSISSITTDVACLAVGCDTSTLVEESNTDYSKLPITDHKVQNDFISPKSTHFPDGPLSKPIRSRSNSTASSLDKALDEFIHEFETTQYFTPSQTLLLENITTHTDVSKDFFHEQSVVHNKPQHQYQHTYRSQSSILNPRTRSSSTRSTSLYQAESSWMDPEEDSMVNTSTPNTTTRYISLNINPRLDLKTPLTSEFPKPNLQNNFDEVKKSSSAKGHNFRYSSYDVYNILKKDEDNEIEPDTSFKSFIKSFW